MPVCHSDTIPQAVLAEFYTETLCSIQSNSQLQLPRVMYWELKTPDMGLLGAYTCTVTYNSVYCGVAAMPLITCADPTIQMAHCNTLISAEAHCSSTVTMIANMIAQYVASMSLYMLLITVVRYYYSECT